jgi:predicted Ser/Thr protein kinase
MIGQVTAHLGYENFRTVNGKIQEQKEPADIVLAMALVHWVYSCTADFGSLDAVIKWLASISRHALVVEWVAPQDSAIANFKHTEFNQAVQSEPYTYAAFRAALGKYFPQVKYLGHVTDTRSLFLCKKTRAEVDLSGPLPLLEDATTILSSRFLAAAGALQFWSVVYDVGDAILKQASFDLAAHEAAVLRTLDGPLFPRVLDAGMGAGYSTVRVEKIRGQTVQAAAETLSADAGTFRVFVDACLDILVHMAEKGIRHRDIRPDNVIVRDNLPVLIDFGWAVSPAHPYYTPAPFQGQPANVDLIGMAGVIRAAGGEKFAAIGAVLARMSQSMPRLAPTELPELRELFHAALA